MESLYNLQLIDIPFNGPRFTWTNNRENDQLIMERLDRAYATMNWLEDNPSTCITNLPITISDHGPILLQTSPLRLQAWRPYQVESWCLRFTTVCDMVKDTWAINIVGSPAYLLVRRLEVLRNRLKAWCLDRKLFWGINWRHLFEKLQSYGRDIQTLQDGVVFNHQQKQIAQELSLAHQYWRQRVKTNFIQLGDSPSKLLFRRLRPRNSSNTIHMLQHPNGEWTSGPDELADLIKTHFANIFTSNGDHDSHLRENNEAIDLVLRELNLPQLTLADINLLMCPFSGEEIKQAMFSFANDKSPGPDGFNAEFFKTYWSTVGEGVIQAVQRFFTTGHLLKE